MKRQKSILVVDDEVMIGEMVQEILAPIYEEVIFKSKAAEAVRLIKEKRFSLILSDVHMPELDGTQFIRMVRSLGHLDPVVFLTGNSSKELLISAIRLGASDVIEKPFEEVDLLASIDRIFDLEKRKMQLFENIIKQADIILTEKQRRMIGLLQVVSEQKGS